MGKYGDLMKVYKFGDIPVGVETRGVYFNDNCINYLAEKAKPEFVIKATDKDLESCRTIYGSLISLDNFTKLKQFFQFLIVSVVHFLFTFHNLFVYHIIFVQFLSSILFYFLYIFHILQLFLSFL